MLKSIASAVLASVLLAPFTGLAAIHRTKIVRTGSVGFKAYNNSFYGGQPYSKIQGHGDMNRMNPAPQPDRAPLPDGVVSSWSNDRGTMWKIVRTAGSTHRVQSDNGGQTWRAND